MTPGRPRKRPDVEVGACPIDVNGTAVIDGCLGDFFIQKYDSLEETLTSVKIENDRAIRTSIECADKRLREEFIEYLFENDENSDRVGEFAIGTNTCLTELIYEILQDEKFPGVHIAFGSPGPNQTGANWDCTSRLDSVINSPTVIADGVTIMEKGQFRLE